VRQIQQRMAVLGMTRADLARKLKVSRPVVTRLLQGKPNMEMNSAVKLAAAVGLELHVQLLPKSDLDCWCCTQATTEAELLERHGSLEQFEAKALAAVPEWISVSEAEAASEKYRLALAYAAARDENKTAELSTP